MYDPATRQRIEHIGLAVGVLAALVTVVVVINWVLQSDQGPLEPSPEPTSLPTLGPTQGPVTATPTSAFDPAPPPEPGSLLHMLGYAPDRLADDSLPLSDVAQYADIQRWMASRGIETPTDPFDPSWDAWQSELSALALPEVLATRGTDNSWISTYGFGLHDVHQVLTVGSAPDYVMVIRGNFNADVLATTWADSGYQAVRVDNVTYWSLYPGDSVDLSAPASRPALGNMNNLTVLEDGTLIATSRSSRMEQTIRTVQEDEPSLAQNPEIQALLPAGTEPETFVTALILKGSVLEPPAGTPIAMPMGTPIAQNQQAQVLVAGVQLRDDGPDKPRMVLVARYDSPEAATTAYSRVSYELSSGTSSITQRPYLERVHPAAMRVLATIDGGSLLFLNLDLKTDISDWLLIIEERDLGYIMWPRNP